MFFRPIHLLAGAIALMMSPVAAAEMPETVYFASVDGRTELVGYLFRPATGGAHPAMVMLHGRAGPYSANVNADCTLVARSTRSHCNATTLSKRHEMWSEYWAAHGYLALLVDSFGPRGKAHGFGRFTHDDPDRDDVNERTVRPLDAEGAFAYLRSRNDVVAGNIFLQGWSNGGSTVLNVMLRQGVKPDGFRAAIAFYPGCGETALLAQTLATTARVEMFLGAADEEVSPAICQHVAERSRNAGSPVSFVVYDGATHDFDDPGPNRQSIAANRAAASDAFQRAIALIESRRGN